MTDELYPVGVDPEADMPYKPSLYEVVILKEFVTAYPGVRTYQQAFREHGEFEHEASDANSDVYVQEALKKASRAWTSAKVLQYYEDNGLDFEAELAALDESE